MSTPGKLLRWADGRMLSRLFWYIPNLIALWWALVTDKRVPWLAKLVAIAGVVYLLSPVDWLPDWLGGLGLLDDVAVLYLTYRLLVKSAPKEVVAGYVSMLSRR
jgi:uncharacterized membrane protein YkvA (DUF1232 family)